MAKIASAQKKHVGDKIREIERSLGYANHETKHIIGDLLDQTESKEVVLGTKDEVFGDPESFLCIQCDPIDGIQQTWGSGPCPCYVYGLKATNQKLRLMVMFSNGETAEIDPDIDVFESLFLAKQLLNKLYQ